jgi:hypothetical protein
MERYRSIRSAPRRVYHANETTPDREELPMNPPTPGFAPANTVVHVDPHVVVLLALLTFWGVYLAIRMRDAVADYW